MEQASERDEVAELDRVMTRLALTEEDHLQKVWCHRNFCTSSVLAGIIRDVGRRWSCDRSVAAGRDCSTWVPQRIALMSTGCWNCSIAAMLTGQAVLAGACEAAAAGAGPPRLATPGIPHQGADAIEV